MTVTGAPYEVVAVCNTCSVQVLVCTLEPWLPPPAYRCTECWHADEEALVRRGYIKPVKPLPAESEGPYSMAARQLGLLE